MARAARLAAALVTVVANVACWCLCTADRLSPGRLVVLLGDSYADTGAGEHIGAKGDCAVQLRLSDFREAGVSYTTGGDAELRAVAERALERLGLDAAPALCFRAAGTPYAPRWRFSDGLVLGEALAHEMHQGGSASNRSVVQGWAHAAEDALAAAGPNATLGLAVSYAGALEDTFGLLHTRPAHLAAQVDRLEELLEPRRRLPDGAVVVVSVAGNDLARLAEAIEFTGSVPVADVVNVTAAVGRAVESAVARLVGNLGAARVLVVTPLPTGCFPGSLTTSNGTTRPGWECDRDSNAASRLMYASVASAVRSGVAGRAARVPDMHALFEAALGMGRWNTVSACCIGAGGAHTCGLFAQGSGVPLFHLCDDPGEHAFFDALHPSDALARTLAKLVTDACGLAPDGDGAPDAVLCPP